ncbi:amidohydrolase family protein [Salinigranum rubrum]|uniref:Amidohydrolase family protein n=1 Tax=Salinigranum rubrum TaxID=755307 RepID=A0A2I8VL19_9EURY|nr:amidohydrolase family protein [Salinigranum rubrum]AUV82630.1 amidohydrolase family protein [Salinigranum rubrum]
MLLRDARLLSSDVDRVGDLRVVDGRIGAVGDLTPRSDERCLGLDGRTLMPGLVDAHVHFSLSAETTIESVVNMSDAELALAESRNARKTLEAGVTGVRAMGAAGVDLHLKRAVERGDVPGPRMVANGRSITVTGGHGHHLGREIDGPVDARKAVREQVKRGADFIKFMTTGGVTTPGTDPDTVALTDDELDALVDETHRHGLHAATHVHGAEGAKAAALAGVDTIEHGTFLDEEAIELMLSEEVTLVPTLSAPYYIVRNVEWATPDTARKTEHIYERHIDSFARAVEAGVTIAGGTDAGTPFNDHGANAAEVTFMIEHGLSPRAAIEAMTETAARTVGLDDCGTLDEGAHADLLVIQGDPLEDSTRLNAPEAVLFGGELASGYLPTEE